MTEADKQFIIELVYEYFIETNPAVTRDDIETMFAELAKIEPGEAD